MFERLDSTSSYSPSTSNLRHSASRRSPQRLESLLGGLLLTSRRTRQHAEGSRSSQGRRPLYRGNAIPPSLIRLAPPPESSSSRQRLPLRNRISEPAATERVNTNANPRDRAPQGRREESEQTCPICRDNVYNELRTSECRECKVQYHEGCLEAWLKHCREAGNEENCPHW